ncbi:rhodanese-like domain-containing protein [Ancylobacter amanitiformis]|uniref:Rhodanese-related sulfurtransferase n=1 Tax=Ancylobacter amanitiformis TaxID=217069 RepID=A0ABU0LMR7_9HYPH|nr:rhodanese-like domain-containing protein [Ancylobacter amanitiformis]MDQ0509990.1 rhodanese-related sulfurtransferase [Ancylobacter amanitiformis]
MQQPNPFGGMIEHLSVDEVKAGLEAGTILLVDVREPNELAAERIPGAVDFPLSTFEASQLPDPGEKTLVFSCRSGQRSQRAAAAAQAAGVDLHRHMAGGILAWKEAGFETLKG